MADDKNRVPLFDGTNFSNWKFRMEALLDEKDLLELVTELYSAKVVIQEGDTEQAKKEKRDRLVELRKNDKKCKSQIIQRIADSHLEYVKDAETAYEMWSTLQTTFERKSMASQVLLRKKLLTMKFNVGTDSMNTHFLKFDGTIRELKSARANLEQSDVVCHLLLTMPPEYDTVVTAIETLASEELTISFVKNRLLDEESKRLGSRQEKGKEASTSSAFVAPTRNKKFDGRSKLKCFNCGIIGHKKSECRKPKSKTEAKICEVNTELCFAGFAQGEADSSWYLDSGCTEHLAKSSNSLKNVRPLEKPIQIRSAKSGTFLTAKEMGDIPVKTVIGEQTKRITIKNVLVVPNLEFNLLSVRRLEMNGLKIIFENGNGNIFKNDELVAVAHRKEKLYELAFKLPDVECAAVASSTTDTAELWHKRLGHIGRTGLEKVKDLVDGMEVNLPKNSCICPVCVEGKQTKLPHVQLRTRAQRPLQLVHSDLMGPIQNEAYNEKQYILTFIDDYTHFVVVYLLETKSEVFKYFKQYEAMVNSHFERRISRLRCDNGREYLSNDMTKYLKSRGIQHELTIRYTPQQNGVAERMNRTLMERARCMLLGSKLEKCLWTEAILTAAYLVNRSPTSSLKDQVPAELWYGEKPNLNKLKKSLYGLKQAPRAWNSRFDTFMEKLMFERSKNDKCLYVQKTNGNEIYLVLYVDDIILAGKNPDSLNIIKEKLKQEFNMTDLGKLRLFLGIKIDCSENGMFLSQQVYIRQMLKKFGMEECKPVKTPMVLKPANESEEKDEDIPEKPYRELVGSLMFLMLNTRPDISTAVNYYSRFQSEPKHSHWIGLKRILRYLQGTASHGLFYPRGECPALTCYADSDWAGGADRRSTSGFLIEVFWGYSLLGNKKTDYRRLVLYRGGVCGTCNGHHRTFVANKSCKGFEHRYTRASCDL
jgi:hypothetical protein